jgi:hypothetical protein
VDIRAVSHGEKELVAVWDLSNGRDYVRATCTAGKTILPGAPVGAGEVLRLHDATVAAGEKI